MANENDGKFDGVVAGVTVDSGDTSTSTQGWSQPANDYTSYGK